MIGALSHPIRVALGMPLPLAIVRILRKIGCNFFWLRKFDFYLSPDFKWPSKASKILLTSVKEAGFNENTVEDIVQDSVVMEIGCGGYFGLAPFAFSSGAKAYYGVDPSLDLDFINANELTTEFLTTALQTTFQNSAGYKQIAAGAPQLTGSKTVDEFFKICSFLKLGIDQVQLEEQVDVCFSISCLEHIHNFNRAAAVISNLSHFNTTHFHIVNFSNHISKQQPFQDLYESPYKTFANKWNNNINGLRVSDMLNCFRKENLDLHSITLDQNIDILPASIDDYWLSRYNKEELAIRVAILTNL